MTCDRKATNQLDEHMTWTLAHSCMPTDTQPARQTSMWGHWCRQTDEGKWECNKAVWYTGRQTERKTHRRAERNTGAAAEWVWIPIRLYPAVVVSEKGTVWPSSLGSAIRADIWICREAKRIYSKHHPRIITTCNPVKNQKNILRVSVLFADPEWWFDYKQKITVIHSRC